MQGGLELHASRQLRADVNVRAGKCIQAVEDPETANGSAKQWCVINVILNMSSSVPIERTINHNNEYAVEHTIGHAIKHC